MATETPHGRDEREQGACPRPAARCPIGNRCPRHRDSDRGASGAANRPGV